MLDAAVYNDRLARFWTEVDRPQIDAKRARTIALGGEAEEREA